MRFHRLDLNLLVALDALLTHQNVTKAAEQLNLSQSALSGALARLREHFDDELVVLVGRRMEPTPLAQSLAEPLHEVLLKTKALVMAKSSFDPLTSERRISLVASDYAIELLVTGVLRDMAQQAPHIRVVLEETTKEKFEKFDRGEINFIIAPDRQAFQRHPREYLFDEKYVCVVWTENTLVGESLSLDQYQTMPHIVRYSKGTLQTTFEQRFLDQIGCPRNESVIVPSFTLVPKLVIGTDRIATVHARLAELYSRVLPLRIVTPPFEFPILRQVLQWHRHEESDPCFAWFRGMIKSAANLLTENSSMDRTR